MNIDCVMASLFKESSAPPPIILYAASGPVRRSLVTATLHGG